MNASISPYKRKILNDPIYGFITIPHPLIFELIQHPYFQRLRRISQLSLTHLVYPGALHTRFQHAIGAMHLMQQAIEVLRYKGNEITDEEELGALIAILLHDIGHGPFSHTLENDLVSGITHEEISQLLMEELNKMFKKKLSIGIQIFKGTYSKKFLHQLVSSQLDMDRLDYLKRDSFFSGVSEGVVSSDRIIKTMDVVNDRLVIEQKGIYSVEKFLIARRLMYWQVYLHKTVIGAEYMMIQIIRRAKELSRIGKLNKVASELDFFLYNRITALDFQSSSDIVSKFVSLDDFDIISSIKLWTKSKDKILRKLCQSFCDRALYKSVLNQDKQDVGRVNNYRIMVEKELNLKPGEGKYFVFETEVINSAYSINSGQINILFKDGTLKDIAEAADLLNIQALSNSVKKYLFCYPKWLITNG